MVRIVIHIRYKNLSPGMHAEADRGSRGVVVYLLPGLTAAQRGAALRRLRQEGNRGCGPRLPSGQLAVALIADRLRAGVTHTGAAIRQHPVGMLLPAVLAGLLLTMFVLASVSVRDSGATTQGAGPDSMSIAAGTPGRGGPGGHGGMPPSAVSVGGVPAGTSATGDGAYAAVVLGPLAGTGAEVAGLAASAGAATAPLPEAPPIPKGAADRNVPVRDTPTRGSLPGGGSGRTIPSPPPTPTAPAAQSSQPVPPGSAAPQPSPDPSASPTSGATPAPTPSPSGAVSTSSPSGAVSTPGAPFSQSRVPPGM